MNGKVWTPFDIECAEAMHRAGVSLDVIARSIYRPEAGVAKKLRSLGHTVTLWRAPPAYERVTTENGKRSDAVPETTSDDAGHVRAVLNAGGFGRIPLAWHEPKPFVWRAA